MASEVAFSSPSEDALRRSGLAPQYVPVEETARTVTEKISGLALETVTTRGWWLLFLPSLSLCGLFGAVIVYLLVKGVGIWGINIPVAWCFAITCFVWWIGIGHAGTLISAFLLLMHQKWRTSINRLAEAMTIFAVMTAGLFPLLHLGRPWFFYWLLPYPNTMGLWPQFRSALVWDVFAVSTYFLVSLLFWYMGMIPDLATLRDRATTRWRRLMYGILAMGWRNSARHWHRYETAYLLLAGLATPLVISVHSVVSADFAIANVPGWHETVFPPYFVAGAIFSGFAMVLLISISLRRWLGLEAFITQDHLDVMGKLLLATSLITSYGYLSEQFTTYYGGEQTDVHVYWYRLTDFHKYAAITWTLFTCNTIVPQVLWIRPLRRSTPVLFFVSVVVLVGMFFERYMIIASSLSEDFLPSSFGLFKPTVWDILTYAGSLGFFATLFLLFIAVMPVISMSEMRAMLPGARTGGGTMKTTPAIWGLLVEFDSPEAILAATRSVRRAGYRQFDAHTPYPVDGLPTELGLGRSRIGPIVLIGGLVGVAVGFGMQFYSMAIDYPLNVGGRPLNSWPAFIPITFEMLILIAALSAFFGMLFLNGLPRPHHPLFGVPQFSWASQDRFFLSVEAADALFDLEDTRRLLETLRPISGVIVVPETEPTSEELTDEEAVVSERTEEPVAL